MLHRLPRVLCGAVAHPLHKVLCFAMDDTLVFDLLRIEFSWGHDNILGQYCLSFFPPQFFKNQPNRSSLGTLPPRFSLCFSQFPCRITSLCSMRYQILQSALAPQNFFFNELVGSDQMCMDHQLKGESKKRAPNAPMASMCPQQNGFFGASWSK
jgi:hypothetical protein